MVGSVGGSRRGLVAGGAVAARTFAPRQTRGAAQTPAGERPDDAAAFLSGVHGLLVGVNEALGGATGDDAWRPADDPCSPSAALAVLSRAPAEALRARTVPASLAAAHASLVDAAEFTGERFRFLDRWLACGDVAARLVADDLYLAARTKLRLAREGLAAIGPKP